MSEVGGTPRQPCFWILCFPPSFLFFLSLSLSLPSLLLFSRVLTKVLFSLHFSFFFHQLTLLSFLFQTLVSSLQFSYFLRSTIAATFWFRFPPVGFFFSSDLCLFVFIFFLFFYFYYFAISFYFGFSFSGFGLFVLNCFWNALFRLHFFFLLRKKMIFLLVCVNILRGNSMN